MNEINKKYFFPLTTIILLIIVCFFAVFYFFQEIVKTSEEFLVMKSQEKLIEESKRLGRTDDYYDEASKRAENIENLFIDPEKPISEVIFLREVAEKNNLSIDINLDSERRDETEVWAYLRFRIQVSGIFSDFLDFLNEVEAREWIMEIESLNVRRVGEEIEGQESEIASEIYLKIYFLE